MSAAPDRRTVDTKQPCVETSLGAIQGVRGNGVCVFHGVPYAQPPVDERRFRSPLPPECWAGVRDASVPGPASYQTNDSNRQRVKDIVKAWQVKTVGIPPRPSYSEATYSEENASEDCLYLDIWVPDSGREDFGNLAVYIYYHGGANASSSGHKQYEDGSNLCREENIIVIRPTYRSGILGWVHLGLLSDLYPEAINLGLQDQIAALKWVHEHIASFGGDKSNITVGGESAGGTAVSGLLTYPPTQPLIRRAIIQSLSPFHAWCTQERQDATTVAQMFLQLLEIEDPAKLAKIHPDYFLAAHSVLMTYFHPDHNGAWSPVGPVVDGSFVPQHPVQWLSQARYPRADFELMLGFAKDEWQYSRGQSNTAQRGTRPEVEAVFAQVLGEDGARDLYDDYSKLYPHHNKPGHILGDVMSYEFFKHGELCIARNFAAHNFPVFVFQFSLDLPGYGGWLRAVHTGDMPIIFRNLTDDTLKHFPGFDGVDRQMLRRIATKFGAMYGSFIRQGTPGKEWPAFETTEGNIMWLGEDVHAVPNLLDGEWEAFSRAGIHDFPMLQHKLIGNTRRALNVRSRFFAPYNHLDSAA